MTELEQIQKILHRYKKTTRFKEDGFKVTQRKGCGESTIIGIDDNRNPGHSFELGFNSDGNLNQLDFGY